MTFGELLANGEGKVYIAKKNNPVRVTEIDCIAVSKAIAKERRYFYFSWYEDRQPFQYIIAKKSKDKRRARRDGIPSVVYISSTIAYVPLGNEDLTETKTTKCDYIIFSSKEEACDYVIGKIKQRKLELNSYILNINKMKFSIA